jgi:hypothetical protein
LTNKPSRMCETCKPIVGTLARKHTTSECPLKQSAYCGLCGTRGHFGSDCSYRSWSQPPQQTPLTELPPPSSTNPLKPYCMVDSNDAYCEYLKLYGEDQSSKKDANQARVKLHLKERGYRLVHPPSKPTTPSVFEKSKKKVAAK